MLIRLDLNPSERQLRQFGWLAFVAFFVIGGLALWLGGLFGFDFGDAAPTFAYVVWGLGVASAICSLVFPAANRPLFVVLTLIAFPIGWIISHLVLAFLFYGVLTPIALVFRLIGRDHLERRFEPERTSYWTDVPKARTLEEYFRQF